MDGSLDLLNGFIDVYGGHDLPIKVDVLIDTPPECQPVDTVIVSAHLVLNLNTRTDAHHHRILIGTQIFVNGWLADVVGDVGDEDVEDRETTFAEVRGASGSQDVVVTVLEVVVQDDAVPITTRVAPHFVFGIEVASDEKPAVPSCQLDDVVLEGNVRAIPDAGLPRTVDRNTGKGAIGGADFDADSFDDAELEGWKQLELNANPDGNGHSSTCGACTVQSKKTVVWEEDRHIGLQVGFCEETDIDIIGFEVLTKFVVLALDRSSVPI